MSKATFARWAMAIVCSSAMLVGTAGAIPPPNDPLYPRQVAAGGALNLIREPQALGAIGSTPLAQVLVSNLDTGIDLTHPDFQGKLFQFPDGNTPAPLDYGNPTGNVPAGSFGWDMLGTPNSGDHRTIFGSTAPHPNAQDPGYDPNRFEYDYGNPPPAIGPVGTGHGTAVAGVLGAGFNNGRGGVGVAPNARFMPIRTCWDYDACYVSIVRYAVDWAAARGVRVASMSWDCCTDPNNADSGYPALHTAFQNASNTLFVGIPGGNGGAADSGTARYPCNDSAPNVLCVSTSSPTDGLDCGEYNATIVDLAVPTQNNQTTLNGGTWGATGCATSFASPTAAGAATVLFGLDPSATPRDVKAALIDSSRRVAAWQGKSVSGGILDLAAAVRLFAQRRGIALRPDSSTGGPTGPTGPTGPGQCPTGQSGTPPGCYTPTAVLSAVAQSHRIWREAGSRNRRLPTGTTFSFRLNTRAPVAFGFTQRVLGRRARGRCVAPTGANRRGAACRRTITVGRLSYIGFPGINRHFFAGKVSRSRRLKPGRYALAINTSRAARPKTLTFSIAR